MYSQLSNPAPACRGQVSRIFSPPHSQVPASAWNFTSAGWLTPFGRSGFGPLRGFRSSKSKYSFPSRFPLITDVLSRRACPFTLSSSFVYRQRQFALLLAGLRLTPLSEPTNVFVPYAFIVSPTTSLALAPQLPSCRNFPVCVTFFASLVRPRLLR